MDYNKQFESYIVTKNIEERRKLSFDTNNINSTTPPPPKLLPKPDIQHRALEQIPNTMPSLTPAPGIQQDNIRKFRKSTIDRRNSRNKAKSELKAMSTMKAVPTIVRKTKTKTKLTKKKKNPKVLVKTTTKLQLEDIPLIEEPVPVALPEEEPIRKRRKATVARRKYCRTNKKKIIPENAPRTKRKYVKSLKYSKKTKALLYEITQSMKNATESEQSKQLELSEKVENINVIIQSDTNLEILQEASIIQKWPRIKHSYTNYFQVFNIGFAETTKGIVYKCFSKSCKFQTYDQCIFKNHLISFHDDVTSTSETFCAFCNEVFSSSSLLNELEHINEKHLEFASNTTDQTSIEDFVDLQHVADKLVYLADVPNSTHINEKHLEFASNTTNQTSDSIEDVVDLQHVADKSLNLADVPESTKTIENNLIVVNMELLPVTENPIEVNMQLLPVAENSLEVNMKPLPVAENSLEVNMKLLPVAGKSLVQEHETILEELEPVLTEHQSIFEILEPVLTEHQSMLEELEPVLTEHQSMFEILEPVLVEHEHKSTIASPNLTQVVQKRKNLKSTNKKVYLERRSDDEISRTSKPKTKQSEPKLNITKMMQDFSDISSDEDSIFNDSLELKGSIFDFNDISSDESVKSFKSVSSSTNRINKIFNNPDFCVQRILHDVKKNLSFDGSNMKKLKQTEKPKLIKTSQLPTQVPVIPTPSTQSSVQTQIQVTVQTPVVMNKLNIRTLQPWIDKRPNFKYEVSCMKMLEKNSLFATYKCMGFTCSYFTSSEHMFYGHLKLHQQNHLCDYPDTYLFCSYCSHTFEKIKDLMNHIKEIHQHDKYQCSHCFYRSCEVQSCSVHMDVYHSKQETKTVLECEIENVPIDIDGLFEKLIENRLKYVAPLRCKVCNISIFLLAEYLEHMNDHVDTSPVSIQDLVHNEIKTLEMLFSMNHYGFFQCLYCLHGTDIQDDMRAHLANKHASEFSYVCKRESDSLSKAESPQSIKSTQLIKLINKKMVVEKFQGDHKELENKDSWCKFNDKFDMMKSAPSTNYIPTTSNSNFVINQNSGIVITNVYSISSETHLSSL